MKCLVRAFFRSVQITVAEFRNNIAEGYTTVKKYGQKVSKIFEDYLITGIDSEIFKAHFQRKTVSGYLITGFDCNQNCWYYSK